KREKLVFILNHCRATALVSEAKSKISESSLKTEVPSLKFCVACGRPPDATGNSAGLNFDAIQAAFPPKRPARVNIDRDLACLIYTSGTMGDAKGVVCDHSNMVFVAGSVIEYLRKVESDVVLNVLPLAFSYVLYQALMTFKVGGTLVLENSFAYPNMILEQMEREKVTGFAGVPSIF